MKHILSFFLAGCMLLVLNACTLPIPFMPSLLDASTEVTAPTQTTSGTEATAEAGPPATATVSIPETESTGPADGSAFSAEICREDFPIFGGPSYDYGQTGTVGIAGTHTIVEEVVDSEGNRWGKLESGSGWVDLSLNERETVSMPPVTVSPADAALLSSGNYHYCKVDNSTYAYDIAFRAHAVLTDVSFFSIDGVNGYERGPELFHLPTWDPGIPFVASISFPGDFSLFGLEFTDSQGITQIYAVSESGRNGSINIRPLTTPLSPADPVPDSNLETPAIPDTLDLYFSSGVGAWGTSLTLNGNGSFSGFFHDSNMGETGDGYDRGTCYVCDFTGAFQITGTSAYAVNLSLSTLTVKDYAAEEWIEDDIRYIAGSAYGIVGGSNFLLFMPSTPVEALPEEIANWYHGGIPETGTLGCYALYCVETGYTFLGD